MPTSLCQYLRFLYGLLRYGLEIIIAATAADAVKELGLSTSENVAPVKE